MSEDTDAKQTQGNRAFGKNNAKIVKDDYFGQANAVHSMTAGSNHVMISFDLLNALKFQHALEIGANQLNRYNKAQGEQRVIALCFFHQEEELCSHVTVTEAKAKEENFVRADKSTHLYVDYNSTLLTLHRLRQSVSGMRRNSSLDVVIDEELAELRFNFHQVDPNFIVGSDD